MIATLNQLIQRTRQHHAIEHATIHLLSAQLSNAMLRMQSGERSLAIHPLLLVLGALVASAPLGFRLQAFTTSAEIHDRWLVDVQPVRVGRVTVHRVLFE